MTFKEYLKKYGPDGYCSLMELAYMKQTSRKKEYDKIIKHWEESHYKKLEEISSEIEI